MTGTWALTEGDSDEEMRWGGTAADGAMPSLVAPIAPDEDGETVNTLTLPAPVATLQEQLNELGFWFVRRARAGTLERYTRWAVREFQIYAKMPRVARQVRPFTGGDARYVDCLEGAANPQRYTGAVSGVATLETRRAIQFWIANRLRCPVVVEAWPVPRGQRRVPQGQNLWLHDEFTSSAPRMYVRDFSGHYPMPAGRNADDLIVLGDWVPFGRTRWNGPRSFPPAAVWREAEMTPERLVGVQLGRMTPRQRSTYKVVRAVAEVECAGFFDSVNSYDNAFVSLGPCHWTLGIADDDVSGGELGGYLAFLEATEQRGAARVLDDFGVRPEKSWLDARSRPTGRPLFDSGLRIYTGWVAVQGEDGSYRRLALDEQEGNYFKSWHWFYRWVMGGRTNVAFQRQMWPMARIRLRDIRSTPFGRGTGLENSTIGSVFTSERALALLLRWHIRSPSHIVSGGVAGLRVRAALTRAKTAAPRLNWQSAPATWTDAHEAALVQGLRAEAQTVRSGDLASTIPQVDGWPSWAGGNNPRGYTLDRSIGRLSEARNSLAFEDAGLPNPPY